MYSFFTFIAEAGGFAGVFLGYSVSNIYALFFYLVNKLWKIGTNKTQGAHTIRKGTLTQSVFV